MIGSKDYIVGHLISNDGTKIGYRQLGNGPGVILVHGGLMASQNFMKLARFLSDEFTVYIPDRRGRGLSGPFGPHYGIQAECEDLQELVHETAAENIFGLSSGAICVLQAAMVEPILKKVALYELPISFSGAIPAKWSNRYESAMEEGNLGKAFITILKGTDPSLFTDLPGFLTIPLANFAIKANAKKTRGDDISLKDLIPTVHYDLILVRASIEIADMVKDLNKQILLMGGTKSPRFLRQSLDALQAALPQAKKIELQGLGHVAADNDGNPEIIGTELKAFFQSVHIQN
jgi:pimeloyl-ACP methyl ester carboxylesterase